MKKERRYGVFSLVLRVCVQYFKTAKGWGVVEHGVAVLRALSYTTGIIVTQGLFDAITDTRKGEHNFWRVAAHLGAFAAIVVGQQLLSGVGKYLFNKVSYTNMGKFMTEFQRKLGRLPAINFESIDFLNNVNKAKECLEYESLGHFASICLQIFGSTP